MHPAGGGGGGQGGAAALPAAPITVDIEIALTGKRLMAVAVLPGETPAALAERVRSEQHLAAAPGTCVLRNGAGSDVTVLRAGLRYSLFAPPQPNPVAPVLNHPPPIINPLETALQASRAFASALPPLEIYVPSAATPTPAPTQCHGRQVIVSKRRFLFHTQSNSDEAGIDPRVFGLDLTWNPSLERVHGAVGSGIPHVMPLAASAVELAPFQCPVQPPPPMHLSVASWIAKEGDHELMAVTRAQLGPYLADVSCATPLRLRLAGQVLAWHLGSFRTSGAGHAHTHAALNALHSSLAATTDAELELLLASPHMLPCFLAIVNCNTPVAVLPHEPPLAEALANLHLEGGGAMPVPPPPPGAPIVLRHMPGDPVLLVARLTLNARGGLGGGQVMYPPPADLPFGGLAGHGGQPCFFMYDATPCADGQLSLESLHSPGVEYPEGSLVLFNPVRKGRGSHGCMWRLLQPRTARFPVLLRAENPHTHREGDMSSCRLGWGVAADEGETPRWRYVHYDAASRAWGVSNKAAAPTSLLSLALEEELTGGGGAHLRTAAGILAGAAQRGGGGLRLVMRHIHSGEVVGILGRGARPCSGQVEGITERSDRPSFELWPSTVAEARALIAEAQAATRLQHPTHALYARGRTNYVGQDSRLAREWVEAAQPQQPPPAQQPPVPPTVVPTVVPMEGFNGLRGLLCLPHKHCRALLYFAPRGVLQEVQDAELPGLRASISHAVAQDMTALGVPVKKCDVRHPGAQVVAAMGSATVPLGFASDCAPLLPPGMAAAAPGAWPTFTSMPWSTSDAPYIYPGVAFTVANIYPGEDAACLSGVTVTPPILAAADILDCFTAPQQAAAAAAEWVLVAYARPDMTTWLARALHRHTPEAIAGALAKASAEAAQAAAAAAQKAAAEPTAAAAEVAAEAAAVATSAAARSAAAVAAAAAGGAGGSALAAAWVEGYLAAEVLKDVPNEYMVGLNA